jgi:hypothetical protein
MLRLESVDRLSDIGIIFTMLLLLPLMIPAGALGTCHHTAAVTVWSPAAATRVNLVAAGTCNRSSSWHAGGLSTPDFQACHSAPDVAYGPVPLTPGLTHDGTRATAAASMLTHAQQAKGPSSF